MKLSWQNDSNRLECRWSGENQCGDAFPYEAPWAHDESLSAMRDSLIPKTPDFTNVSPFGRSEWRRERPTTQI
jgi:hypothetical protein